MKKLKVGDTVFVVGYGNKARYSQPVYEANVLSIGRKWFKVEEAREHYLSREKFSLETGYCDGGQYTPEWRAFSTREDFDNSIEQPKLLRKLQTNLHKLNYTQLLEVDELVNKVNL